MTPTVHETRPVTTRVADLFDVEGLPTTSIMWGWRGSNPRASA